MWFWIMFFIVVGVADLIAVAWVYEYINKIRRQINDLNDK